MVAVVETHVRKGGRGSFRYHESNVGTWPKAVAPTTTPTTTLTRIEGVEGVEARRASRS